MAIIALLDTPPVGRLGVIPHGAPRKTEPRASRRPLIPKGPQCAQRHTLIILGTIPKQRGHDGTHRDTQPSSGRVIAVGAGRAVGDAFWVGGGEVGVVAGGAPVRADPRAARVLVADVGRHSLVAVAHALLRRVVGERGAPRSVTRCHAGTAAVHIREGAIRDAGSHTKVDTRVGKVGRNTGSLADLRIRIPECPTRTVKLAGMRRRVAIIAEGAGQCGHTGPRPIIREETATCCLSGDTQWGGTSQSPGPIRTASHTQPRRPIHISITRRTCRNTPSIRIVRIPKSRPRAVLRANAVGGIAEEVGRGTGLDATVAASRVVFEELGGGRWAGR